MQASLNMPGSCVGYIHNDVPPDGNATSSQSEDGNALIAEMVALVQPEAIVLEQAFEIEQDEPKSRNSMTAKAVNGCGCEPIDCGSEHVGDDSSIGGFSILEKSLKVENDHGNGDHAQLKSPSPSTSDSFFQTESPIKDDQPCQDLQEKIIPSNSTESTNLSSPQDITNPDYLQEVIALNQQMTNFQSEFQKLSSKLDDPVDPSLPFVSLACGLQLPEVSSLLESELNRFASVEVDSSHFTSDWSADEDSRESQNEKFLSSIKECCFNVAQKLPDDASKEEALLKEVQRNADNDPWRVSRNSRWHYTATQGSQCLQYPIEDDNNGGRGDGNNLNSIVNRSYIARHSTPRRPTRDFNMANNFSSNFIPDRNLSRGYNRSWYYQPREDQMISSSEQRYPKNSRKDGRPDVRDRLIAVNQESGAGYSNWQSCGSSNSFRGRKPFGNRDLRMGLQKRDENMPGSPERREQSSKPPRLLGTGSGSRNDNMSRFRPIRTFNNRTARPSQVTGSTSSNEGHELSFPSDFRQRDLDCPSVQNIPRIYTRNSQESKSNEVGDDWKNNGGFNSDKLRRFKKRKTLWRKKDDRSDDSLCPGVSSVGYRLNDAGMLSMNPSMGQSSPVLIRTSGNSAVWADCLADSANNPCDMVRLSESPTKNLCAQYGGVDMNMFLGINAGFDQEQAYRLHCNLDESNSSLNRNCSNYDCEQIHSIDSKTAKAEPTINQDSMSSDHPQDFGGTTDNIDHRGYWSMSSLHGQNPLLHPDMQPQSTFMSTPSIPAEFQQPFLYPAPTFSTIPQMMSPMSVAFSGYPPGFWNSGPDNLLYPQPALTPPYSMSNEMCPPSYLAPSSPYTPLSASNSVILAPPQPIGTMPTRINSNSGSNQGNSIATPPRSPEYFHTPRSYSRSFRRRSKSGSYSKYSGKHLQSSASSTSFTIGSSPRSSRFSASLQDYESDFCKPNSLDTNLVVGGGISRRQPITAAYANVQAVATFPRFQTLSNFFRNNYQMNFFGSENDPTSTEETINASSELLGGQFNGSSDADTCDDCDSIQIRIQDNLTGEAREVSEFSLSEARRDAELSFSLNPNAQEFVPRISQIKVDVISYDCDVEVNGDNDQADTVESVWTSMDDNDDINVTIDQSMVHQNIKNEEPTDDASMIPEVDYSTFDSQPWLLPGRTSTRYGNLPLFVPTMAPMGTMFAFAQPDPSVRSIVGDNTNYFTFGPPGPFPSPLMIDQLPTVLQPPESEYHQSESRKTDAELPQDTSRVTENDLKESSCPQVDTSPPKSHLMTNPEPDITSSTRDQIESDLESESRSSLSRESVIFVPGSIPLTYSINDDRFVESYNPGQLQLDSHGNDTFPNTTQSNNLMQQLFMVVGDSHMNCPELEAP